MRWTPRNFRILVAALVTAIFLAFAAQASAFELLGQYGTGYSNGSSGNLNTIYGISIAPDGTVVVSDEGNNRISLFAQSGHFLRSFGKDVSLAPGEGPEVCITDCRFGQSSSEAERFLAPMGSSPPPTKSTSPTTTIKGSTSSTTRAISCGPSVRRSGAPG